MELPLTSRELMRQTRRRGMYASRMIVPGAISLALMGILAFNPGVRPETFGNICYVVVYMFQGAVLLLAAPLMTAGLIAREKEERTLPLLLLANARGNDIVLSKYLPVLLICELLILGTLPMLAFAGFFGYVDIPSTIARALYVTTEVAAFAALGMLASSMTHRPWLALGGTYVFIAIHPKAVDALVYVLDAAGLYHFEPNTETFTGSLRIMVPSLALNGFVTVVALLAAGWLVAHESHDRAWRISYLFRRRSARRRPRGNAHALGVLAVHSDPLRGGMQRVLMAILILALTIAAYVIGPVAIPMLIAGVAYQTAHSVRRLVTSGALDDLRLLPLDPWQLGNAVFHKHYVAALYFVPAFVAGASAIETGGLGDPGILIVKILGALVLAFALMRYVVALTSVRATSSHPAVLAMFVLARLLVILVVVSIMSAVLYSALSMVVLWFRWIPLNAIPGPRAQAVIMYVLTFGVLMNGAREPRLQFGRRLEMDLRYQGEIGSWSGGRQ